MGGFVGVDPHLKERDLACLTILGDQAWAAPLYLDYGQESQLILKLDLEHFVLRLDHGQTLGDLALTV